MEENNTINNTNTTATPIIPATIINTTVAFDVTPTTDTPAPVVNDDDASPSIGPTPAKRPRARDSPYNSILLSADRRSRKRKSLSWLPEEKIRKVHYFELFADERSNVYKAGLSSSETDANASAAGGSSPNSSGIGRSPNDPLRRSNDKSETDKCVTHAPWVLVLIDYVPELPTPGWQSAERSAQAEREQYVLGAIDLPGQPSTLDEPDENNAATNCESSTKDGNQAEIIIPLDNAEGAYTEFPDMYKLETVNGIRLASSCSTDCSNVQASIVPNMTQFQQQQQQLPQQTAPQMLQYQYQQAAPQMLQYQYQQQLVNATQSPFSIFRTWFPH